MDSIPNNFQQHPLKLYIQDVFRAKRTEQNKYIYELFGLTFKNIMIHGVVTCIYNKTSNSTNLELSDGTASVQVYFAWNKCNKNVSKEMLLSLHSGFVHESKFGGDAMELKAKMMSAISEKKSKPVDFEEGSYLSVIGDIFVDDIKGTRMVSAYECNLTSVECDIVWLEELRYLYEKFYFWSKE